MSMLSQGYITQIGKAEEIEHFIIKQEFLAYFNRFLIESNLVKTIFGIK